MIFWWVSKFRNMFILNTESVIFFNFIFHINSCMTLLSYYILYMRMIYAFVEITGIYFNEKSSRLVSVRAIFLINAVLKYNLILKIYTYSFSFFNNMIGVFVLFNNIDRNIIMNLARLLITTSFLSHKRFISTFKLVNGIGI